MALPTHPSFSEEFQESYGVAETMDPDMYKATVEGDILQFVKAMEQSPMDRHFNLPTSCIQLGPQLNTVLHVATSFGHHEIVKLLCKDLPFLVPEKDARGDTALHIAARAGDPIMVKLLIGSDFKEGGLGETNMDANTALHEALLHHREDIAWILLNANRNMAYSVNKEGKSLLYLAAEAGYVAITRILLENPAGNHSFDEKHKNMSPVHAAILGRNIDVLKLLYEQHQSSFRIRCDKGRNPLHFAAYIGYTEGVVLLLENFYHFAYMRDKQGFFPIHIASCQGHIDIIKVMLQKRPDSWELLTPQYQNILHITAKSGKWRGFNSMLKMPELEKLINARDLEGNTPLHVATIYGHPKVVAALIWDERVRLEFENNDELTALDISEGHMKTCMASFQKRLTWMALRVVGAPRTPISKSSKNEDYIAERLQPTESCRDKVNVILLVATLVATVTFTAGFTIPGGSRNSDPDQGTATMLANVKFQEFVICDSLAMYFSIIVAVILIWAQLGDIHSMQVALKLALPLLGIALAMMSVAFMAGIYLVVSKLSWLANVVLFIGSDFIIMLVLLFFPLCFLGSSNYQRFRYISYYPFCLMLYALGRDAENEADVF